MSIVDSPEHYAELREEIRLLRPPFLLRHYDATPEDYEQITDEDLKCEFIDGDLIVHSPESVTHEEHVGFVMTLLRVHIDDRKLGRVVGSNAVMQLGERRFSPDVSILLSANERRIRGGRVHGPMDLVVEVLSKSTRDYDLRTKLPAYREGRVGEIWLIDAERRQFEVHARAAENYRSSVLATGEWSSIVLPGLTVKADWFWTNPLPSLYECGLS
jgi:Uma2 family endonuclease